MAARSTGLSSFLQELALGRYQPGDSPLHRAPAAGKALLLGGVAVASFWLQSSVAFVVLGLALAVQARGAGLSQQVFWRSLRPLLLLCLLTMMAGAWLTPPSSLWSPEFRWAGLHQGGLYAARLLTITLLTTLFFLTTRPDDAIALGVRLMAPLRLLGIEAQELTLLVHLAYRFVPLLARELQTLEEGRRARHLSERPSAWGAAPRALDSLVSLMVGALHRAETTALSLDQRGLLGSWPSTSPTPGRWRDLWPLASLGLVVAGLLPVDPGLW